MRQVAITTEIIIPPPRQPIEAFMSEADRLHGEIGHLLQTCPADQHIVLLRLDELLSNAIVELSGRAASWK